WKNIPDDYLVGLIGSHVGGISASSAVLHGAAAELQRRQFEATEELSELQQRQIQATDELADVQRTLLTTIERFNSEAGKQSLKMIRLTWAIAVLTVVLGLIATAQLSAMLVRGA